MTERCVKWSQEAKDFFKSAADNSVTLNIVISHGCSSQTGEGFEELVNSINSDDIKRKIKKVIVTDTSYLYRHSIKVFAKHQDTSIPTIWFLNNRDFLKKIIVNTEFKSWTDGIIDNKSFDDWYKKIKIEFSGDEEGKGIVREFRELVITDAAVAAYKNKCALDKCVDFLLEESAYVCAHLRSTTLVYPVIFTPSFLYVINKYANIQQLCYKTSKQAQHNSNNLKNCTNEIDKEIVSFMKETVSNVNFYVIDKQGRYICRNKEFAKVTCKKSNAKELDETSWKACLDVIETKKQMIVEEAFNGYTLPFSQGAVNNRRQCGGGNRTCG